MWTYKHLSHCKSGHTITTRSCNAKEIPKKIPILDLSIHRHGSFSLSLSCQFINALFLCFREVSGVFRRSPPYIQQWTIWPDMGNQTVELNWILELSECHWKPSPLSQTSPFPHRRKKPNPILTLRQESIIPQFRREQILYRYVIISVAGLYAFFNHIRLLPQNLLKLQDTFQVLWSSFLHNFIPLSLRWHSASWFPILTSRGLPVYLTIPSCRLPIFFQYLFWQGFWRYSRRIWFTTNWCAMMC